MDRTLPEPEIKRQIYRKLQKRVADLEERNMNAISAPRQGAAPDVVVVSTDCVLLFEPQNSRTAEWLHQRFGLGPDRADVGEPIRVHPCASSHIVAELKSAGFGIAFASSEDRNSSALLT